MLPIEVGVDCMVCGKKIFRSTHPQKYRLRRSKRCLTCSPECSRIYTRIFHYVSSKNRCKNK